MTHFHINQKVTIADLDITNQLTSRPSKPRDYKSESEALCRLAQSLAYQPEEIAQELTAAILSLTGAGSSGISVEQKINGLKQFS